MKRTIMSDLLKWKSNPHHKPMMIFGVRQCGKTYIIKEFGTEQYEDMAYVSCEETNVSDVFEPNLNVDRIVKMLGIRRNKPITTDTLIVLDEIQQCPRAITALKYFCEDGRYDVICAGSLLGVKLAESSPPVGKVETVTMYPMSFREYLDACGDNMLADAIDDNPLDKDILAFRNRLIEHYQDYLAVGGLPSAVSTWIETHDPESVDKILRDLTTLYLGDVARYGKGTVRLCGEMVWKSVPSQLAKSNNKFVFGHVGESKRARDLWSSVDWLSKAGLVHLVPITTGHDIPSIAADRSSFKLYCFDTGILRTLADVPFNMGDERFSLYRGACTENLVLLELKKTLPSEIYCWRSGNKAEVDFLTWIGDKLTPIEVKSGTKVRARSLGVYMDSDDCIGAVTSMQDASINGRIVHVPLYMVWTVGVMVKRAYDEH